MRLAERAMEIRTMALVGTMKVKEAMVRCRAVMEAETGIVVVLVEEAIKAHLTMRRVDLEVDMAEAIVARMTMHNMALEEGEIREAVVARLTMHTTALEQVEMGEASLTDVSGKEYLLTFTKLFQSEDMAAAMEVRLGDLSCREAE